MKKTEVIYINEKQSDQYISAHKPFKRNVGVPGIFNMHAMESNGISTKLRRNAGYSDTVM